MISVELLLDAAIESTVSADWQALISADLPSAGRHAGESNRPHVTITARDAPRSLELSTSVLPLPLPLTLGGFVIFQGRAGRCVLARQVVVTEGLLALHRAVTDVVGPADHPRFATTDPARWTPHVTLAPRIPRESLPEALDVVSGEPIHGAAVGMRIWDAAAKTITDVV